MQRQLLPVNEIFQTIQGEATHAGRPSVFVRLQGCPVGCAWCDTKHTWYTEPSDVVTIDVMMDKTAIQTPQHAKMDTTDLCMAITGFQAQHVVLTGGEPCMYDLTDVTTRLLQIGMSVQIETSGTFPIHCHPSTWVTVSPKLAKPGGFLVRTNSMSRANEVKLPVAIQRDIDVFDDFVNGLPVDTRPTERGVPIWLQPVWQNAAKSSQALCIRVATERGWRVSLQTHKFAEVR
jgi:7-carboxy-7-deazaguanine synthase